MSEAEIIRHSCINALEMTVFYKRILSLSEYIYNILHPLVVAKYREDYKEHEYWY